MGTLLVVGGAYFVYCFVKIKREKLAAIKEFESLPYGPEQKPENGE